MATGDTDDILSRLLSQIPPGWFPRGATPVLNALLAAASYAGSFVYGMIQFTRAQARIATATGGWLDLIAFDYFRYSFVRPPGWTDDQMRAQIAFRVLNPNGTRPGLVAGVENLTGRTPIIVEPWNTGDTGAWSDGSFGDFAGDIAWDEAGAWGELDLPNQLFIHVFRPSGGGIANAQGWGDVTDTSVAGGWDSGDIEWADITNIPGQVSDDLIYQTVHSLMPAGTVAWTAISS